MNCNQCGTEISDSTATCGNCNTAVALTIGKKDALTYDYRTVEANQKNAVEIMDCYEALGWEIAGKNDSLSGVSISFKRNRKIKNRDQLNRLQMKLDDHINGIGVYEKRKTQNAAIASIMIGIIGTLLFGAGMCFCMPGVFQSAPDLWMYVVGGVLAALGAATCAVAYVAYQKIRAKSTAAMSILIDKKRDEISQLCEDAQRLLA